MEKTKKYNLRSASSDTQMQTQLGGDMEFVTQLLGVGPRTSSQQGCDSQSSDSELNCSDVINASDSDDTGSRNRSFNKFSQEKSGTSDSHAVDTQTIINRQILAQLTDIGQRLKKLEKPDCKKSNDVTKHKNRSTRTRSKPTPNTLKIINLSKWCLKQQVSKLANLNAIFLLDDSQMLITYDSD